MRVARNIVKVAAITAGAIVLVLLLVAGFTQTKFFRDRLRAIVASSISTRINGSLHLGTLDGNLITGFSIDSLAVASGDETILSSGRIAVRYEPSGFFTKHLTLSYCIVEQPVIHAVRSA